MHLKMKGFLRRSDYDEHDCTQNKANGIPTHLLHKKD